MECNRLHQAGNRASFRDMPFAGLGFDLGAAISRASRLELTPAFPVKPAVMVCYPERRKPVAGYALLLAQGREIRAG